MDDFSPAELTTIEQTTQEVGRSLFARLDHRRPGIWDRRWWDDRIMAVGHGRTSRSRCRCFASSTCCRCCDTNEAIARHLARVFRRGQIAAAACGAVGPGRGHAGRGWAGLPPPSPRGATPCRTPGGSSPAPIPSEVLAAALHERRQRRAFTLDILGEAVTSEVEADRYLQSYLDLVAGIAPAVNAWPEVPQIDRDERGALPRVNVSIKLSALDSQFDPIDRDGTIAPRGRAAAASCCAWRSEHRRSCAHRHGVVPHEGH